MLHQDPGRKRFLGLQVALDRAGFLAGEIDAQIGSETRRALRAFQRAHGLHVTGELDRRTVRRLGPSFSQSITTYCITAEDVERAGVHASVEEMLAERFHTSPALLRFLNVDAGFDEGETLMVPNVHPRYRRVPAA
jgi:peptidoglycan hydrolase-like protein with peptidoglycan-binding domain